jgi:hypothetical protein
MTSFAFTDSGNSGVDGTTFNDTLTVGAGDGSRTFVIVFAGRGLDGQASALSSLTIDGESAALVSDGVTTAQKFETSASGDTAGNVVGIAQIKASELADPTASSVAMSLVFNGTALRAAWAIGVTADAIETAAHHVASDSANKNNVSTDEILDLSVNTVADGFVVGGCFVSDTASGSASNTWSGLTEAYDFQTATENGRFGAAAESDVIAATPRSISATLVHSGAQFSPVGVAASFAPATGGLASPLVGPLGKPVSGLLSRYRHQLPRPPMPGDYIRRRSGLIVRDTRIKRAA